MDPGGHSPVDHPPDGPLPVGLESGWPVQPHLFHTVKRKSADSWYSRSRGPERHLACVASASPNYGPPVGSASALLTISGPDGNGGCRFFPGMPRLSLRDPSSPPWPWGLASCTAGGRARRSPP